MHSDRWFRSSGYTHDPHTRVDEFSLFPFDDLNFAPAGTFPRIYFITSQVSSPSSRKSSGRAADYRPRIKQLIRGSNYWSSIVTIAVTVASNIRRHACAEVNVSEKLPSHVVHFFKCNFLVSPYSSFSRRFGKILPAY